MQNGSVLQSYKAEAFLCCSTKLLWNWCIAYLNVTDLLYACVKLFASSQPTDYRSGCCTAIAAQRMQSHHPGRALTAWRESLHKEAKGMLSDLQQKEGHHTPGGVFLALSGCLFLALPRISETHIKPWAPGQWRGPQIHILESSLQFIWCACQSCHQERSWTWQRSFNSFGYRFPDIF